MADLFRQFVSYLKIIGIKGAFLTVIGLLPLVVAYATPFSSGESPTAPWLEFLLSPMLAVFWLLGAVIVANFLAFREFLDSDIEFKVKQRNCDVQGSWLNDTSGGLSPSNIEVGFSVIVDISNPSQRSTHTQMFIEAVDSEWRLAGGTKLEDIGIQIKPAGNPFTLQPDEILSRVSIAFPLTFTVSSGNAFRQLGSLSRMKVTLRLEQTRESSLLPIEFDVSKIHGKIEADLIRSIDNHQGFSRPNFEAVQEYVSAKALASM